jgi:succinyl-CoA synthetase beta subunit
LLGITAEQAKRCAAILGFPDALAPVVHEQLSKMYRLFIEKDATMLEINPFVETSNGEGEFLKVFSVAYDSYVR